MIMESGGMVEGLYFTNGKKTRESMQFREWVDPKGDEERWPFSYSTLFVACPCMYDYIFNPVQPPYSDGGCMPEGIWGPDYCDESEIEWEERIGEGEYPEFPNTLAEWYYYLQFNGELYEFVDERASGTTWEDYYGDKGELAYCYPRMYVWPTSPQGEPDNGLPMFWGAWMINDTWYYTFIYRGRETTLDFATDDGSPFHAWPGVETPDGGTVYGAGLTRMIAVQEEIGWHIGPFYNNMFGEEGISIDPSTGIVPGVGEKGFA
jgi:hypothetical protein